MTEQEVKRKKNRRRRKKKKASENTQNAQPNHTQENSDIKEPVTKKIRLDSQEDTTTQLTLDSKEVINNTNLSEINGQENFHLDLLFDAQKIVSDNNETKALSTISTIDTNGQIVDISTIDPNDQIVDISTIGTNDQIVDISTIDTNDQIVDISTINTNVLPPELKKYIFLYLWCKLFNQFLKKKFFFRYWIQRYLLFSLYDEGIMMDEGMKISISKFYKNWYGN